jgi:hypothetical protein
MPQRQPPRRKRDTSLPEGHERIVIPDGPRTVADKDLTARALIAALEVAKKHPVRGREFFGRRGRNDLPQEGELDYERALMIQRAAEEVIAVEMAATLRESAAQAEIDAELARPTERPALTLVESAAEAAPTELPAAAEDEEEDEDDFDDEDDDIRDLDDEKYGPRSYDEGDESDDEEAEDDDEDDED